MTTKNSLAARPDEPARDVPKLIFHSRCEKGHETLQVFTRESLQGAVARGAVTFYCGQCADRWVPSVDERVRLRALARGRWPACDPAGTRGASAETP